MPTAAGATMYVWSKSEITLTGKGAAGRLTRGYGSEFLPETTGTETPEYETHLALPEDQQAAVNLVQRIARERQVAVKLIDLSRARHFLERRKALERGWMDFPVLVASNGRTLAGSAVFSEETVINALTSRTYAPR